MSYLFRSFTILQNRNLRLFKRLKEAIHDRITPDPTDIVQGTNLREAEKFQYPAEIQDTIDRDPMDPQEEREVLAETERLVSDLERARLQELDKLYGTNTYFHPINETYEERLDSEHVMEIKKNKRKYLNQTLQPSRLYEFDPQEKIEAPKIRNKQDFYKNLKKMIITPVHDKVASVKTNKFETFIDNYSYLEEKSLTDSSEKMDPNSAEYMRIIQFVSKENLFTEMSVFLNSFLEDKIIKDYFDTIGKDNKVPLFFDNMLYYQKELTAEGFNLYKVNIDNTASNNLVAKLIVENSKHEQNVINQHEILDFLTGYANSNLNTFGRIPHDLILSLKYNENRFELYDISLTNDQNLIALTFEMNNPSQEIFNHYFTLIKNCTTGKFYPVLIDHSQGEVVLDDVGGVYFVRKNETGRALFLSRYNLNAPEGEIAEKVIIEEGDPLFQLEVSKTLSNEYLVLNSYAVSGEPTNEMYIRPLNDPYQEFHLLLPRSKGVEYNIKHSKDYLILLINDSLDETQSVKRIKIITDKSSQNLLTEGEKLGEQILRLTASGLVMKSSQDKTQLKTSGEKSTITSKALVVARLHAIQKEESKEIYGVLEDFPILETGEKINYFIGFENYVIFHIRKADKEYLKVYNHRSEKTHTLKVNEEGVQIESEPNYRYNSQYYHFQLNTLNLPARVASYNMGLRDLQIVHTDHIVGFKGEDITVEHINIQARDGTEIPVTFVYNNKRIQSDSTVVLHSEFNLDSRSYMNFKHENLGLLNRGFIYAYPHIRGSMDLDQDWFKQGSGLQRLTSVTDIIDTASYLLNNEVVSNVCLYGKGELGGLLSAVAVLKAPQLFTSTVLEDPIIDLVEHLLDNNDKKNQKIFGDINDKDIYDHTKEYSPYHTDVPRELQNLMVLSNAGHPLASHSRKFVAKIREKFNDKKNLNRVFFKEVSPTQHEMLKIGAWQAFLINNIFKQDMPM